MGEPARTDKPVGIDPKPLWARRLTTGWPRLLGLTNLGMAPAFAYWSRAVEEPAQRFFLLAVAVAFFLGGLLRISFGEKLNRIDKVIIERLYPPAHLGLKEVAIVLTMSGAFTAIVIGAYVLLMRTSFY
ncbi:MAG TPA: hypothetical protein VNI20_02920 [Fimbriimonadaceae bacterium]|nr:hypothetical protein [Fimbriimonadaceae bacterium]